MAKFCLPIVEQSKAGVLHHLDEYGQDYDFFEVWLDYIADFDIPFIKKLITREGPKITFLLRRLKRGGILLSREVRRNIIKQLDGTSCRLDLDFRTQGEDVLYFQKSNIQAPLILTYQNLDDTPSRERLFEIMDEMIGFRTGGIRFILQCNSDLDAVRLMELRLTLRNKSVPSIVHGVGRHALLANVVMASWGNMYEVVGRMGQFAPEEYAGLTKADIISRMTVLARPQNPTGSS